MVKTIVFPLPLNMVIILGNAGKPDYNKWINKQIKINTDQKWPASKHNLLLHTKISKSKKHPHKKSFNCPVIGRLDAAATEPLYAYIPTMSAFNAYVEAAPKLSDLTLTNILIAT